jgi:hypothetical protein
MQGKAGYLQISQQQNYVTDGLHLEIYRLLFFLGTIWMTEFFIVCEANP